MWSVRAKPITLFHRHRSKWSFVLFLIRLRCAIVCFSLLFPKQMNCKLKSIKFPENSKKTFRLRCSQKHLVPNWKLSFQNGVRLICTMIPPSFWNWLPATIYWGTTNKLKVCPNIFFCSVPSANVYGFHNILRREEKHVESPAVILGKRAIFPNNF